MKFPSLPLMLAAGVFLPLAGLASEATLPATAKYTWVEDSDPSVAEIRSLGDRMIDRVGGAMLSEVTRLLGNMTVEDAVSEVHLKNLELPAAVPGKPSVTAIKRTSMRLRNPANAPDAADKEALELVRHTINDGESMPRLLVQKIEVAGQPVEYRVYKPVAVLPDCLQCHGSTDSLLPGVRMALERNYPEDKAIDYNAYDWRGLIRVTIQPAPAVATTAPLVPPVKK